MFVGEETLYTGAEIQKISSSCNFKGWFLTSAKTDNNVKEAMSFLVDKILERKYKQDQRERADASVDDEGGEGDGEGEGEGEVRERADASMSSMSDLLLELEGLESRASTMEGAIRLNGDDMRHMQGQQADTGCC